MGGHQRKPRYTAYGITKKGHKSYLVRGEELPLGEDVVENGPDPVTKPVDRPRRE